MRGRAGPRAAAASAAARAREGGGRRPLGREGARLLQAAQQFYHHVATTPGQAPSVGSTTVLKGWLGRPIAEGFSRTVNYEISGAGRIDFQYHDAYVGKRGDAHPVVFILRVALSSH